MPQVKWIPPVDLPNDTTLSLPVIDFFIATPDSIASGDPSVLSWFVRNSDHVSLDHGIGRVLGSSFLVSPEVTTKYKLTAINTNGSTEATITVTTVAVPILDSVYHRIYTV